MMGLTSANLTPERGLAQAIGASEVLPDQHFNAYGVLASGGIYHNPTVVLKVEEPAKRQGGHKVGSVAELVDKLKTEARVI